MAMFFLSVIFCSFVYKTFCIVKYRAVFTFYCTRAEFFFCLLAIYLLKLFVSSRTAFSAFLYQGRSVKLPCHTVSEFALAMCHLLAIARLLTLSYVVFGHISG